jgi:hypothetical protein
MARKKKKARKKAKPKPRKRAGKAPSSPPPPEPLQETLGRFEELRSSCQVRGLQQQEIQEAGADQEDTITLSELIEDMDL